VAIPAIPVREALAMNVHSHLSLHGQNAFDIERIHLVAAFAIVAEKLNFAQAASTVGVSASTLSRKVARLEALLGLRLFERTTRTVVLTEIGQLYFEQCRDILLRLNEADSMVSSYNTEPQGLLRVSFPVAFGRLQLPDILAGFIEKYPKVQIEANYTDRFVNLIEEGYNAVVRIGSLSDSSLIVRKIANNRRALVASPTYLAQHGIPQGPADLTRHHCLCYSHYARSGSMWSFRRGDTAQDVPVAGEFRSDSSDAIYEAALRGTGIAIVARYICSNNIADGSLVQILPDWNVVPESSVYIAYASNKHMVPKTRVFSDFLVEKLRDVQW
jgi:DNA-binding transcriptional LysR family regulator